MAKTHMAFGCALWAALGTAAEFSGVPHATGIAVMTMPVVALGSLMPDIDHPESAFGRRVPFLSVPISAIFGHRGITHSLLAVLALFAGAAWAAAWFAHGAAGPTATLMTFGVLPLSVGYLSHLLGDGLTVSGLPLLWPKRRCYRWPLFKTGSATEALFRFAMIALLTGWGAWLVMRGVGKA